MENEEKYLKETVGQENPFRVPEGYFKLLAERVMNQLPEQQKKRRLLLLRPWHYAAAAVLAAVIMGLSFYFHQYTADDQPAVAAVETNTENTYMDEVADYAMLDNAEIYACLADY